MKYPSAFVVTTEPPVSVADRGVKAVSSSRCESCQNNLLARTCGNRLQQTGRRDDDPSLWHMAEPMSRVHCACQKVCQ